MTTPSESPAPKTIAVHVLVSGEQSREIKALAKRRRVTQAILVRDAVTCLLDKYEDDPKSAFEDEDDRLALSLVVRLFPEQVAALKALSEKTRVRQSLYLREALTDYLNAEGPPELHACCDWCGRLRPIAKLSQPLPALGHESRFGTGRCVLPDPTCGEARASREAAGLNLFACRAPSPVGCRRGQTFRTAAGRNLHERRAHV